MDCFAWDVAFANGSGPVADKAKIEYQASTTAFSKLVGSLELEASRACPEGQRCVGLITMAGAPLIAGGAIGNRYSCIVTVSGSFNGECGGATNVAPASDSATVLEADGIRSFFEKVARLPELPDKPTGSCRLYRDQIGHAFPYPICAGDCQSGRCKTTVSVRGDRIRVECSCD